MIEPPPERLVWCFGSFESDIVHDLSNDVEFIDGIPPNRDENNVRRRTMLIIDDLMSETDSRVTDMFTRGSHHKNISVVYVTQNLYNKDKENRTISLNTHYLVLSKNSQDVAQISHLGRQIFLKKVAFFSEVFKDAT